MSKFISKHIFNNSIELRPSVVLDAVIVDVGVTRRFHRNRLTSHTALRARVAPSADFFERHHHEWIKIRQRSLALLPLGLCQFRFQKNRNSDSLTVCCLFWNLFGNR